MNSVGFKQKTARIISTLFVPPSFAVILFPILSYLYDNDNFSHYITALVTLTFGFFFHIIFFFYLRSKGKLIDEDASIKEERTLPFIMGIIFYSIGLIILIKSGVNIISIAFWFCYITNTILILVINKYWKISAHTMGAAGPAAVIVFVFGAYGFLFLLLLLLIAWARVYLKCHDIKQVFAGALAGFIVTYIQLDLITRYFKIN